MKMNKKGFTIVELVIVIAVIAILAGVLIPTFTTIIGQANESKAYQECKQFLESNITLTTGTLPSGTIFAYDSDENGTSDYWFLYEGNALKKGYKVGETGYPQMYAANVYAVYVAADAISGTTLSDTTNNLLNHVLDEGDTDIQLASTTLTAVAGQQYLKADLGEEDTIELRIYYSGDLKEKCVFFLGGYNG